MPEEQLNHLLAQPIPQLTPNTLTDPQRLREQLHQIRKQGYLIDREQTTVGVNGIAAPIFGCSGEFVCAVGVIGPTAQFDDGALVAAKEKIVAAAMRISSRMGYLASK